MKKYLIGIPCLYNSKVTQKSIDSVIGKINVDILIIDNGADIEVKKVIESFRCVKNISIISNEKNIFVNPAWNQIMIYFMQHPEYDYVCIMNSDIIMQPQFNEVLNKHHEKFPDDILIAKNINRQEIYNEIIISNGQLERVYSGTAGTNIVLNRKQVSIIYPIPEWIKIWYGDNWIYEILRGIGYKTYVLDSFLAFHYGSQSVKRLHSACSIIEEDKKNWSLYSEDEKLSIIDKYKFE